MKTNKNFLIIIIFLIVVILGFKTVNASNIGGPNIIYELYYNEETNSVIYIENNLKYNYNDLDYVNKNKEKSDGLSKDLKEIDVDNCPGEIKSLSIDTGEYKTIYSCEDYFKEISLNPKKDYTNFYTKEMKDREDYFSIFNKIYNGGDMELVPGGLGNSYLRTMVLDQNKIKINVDYDKKKNTNINQPFAKNFIATIKQGNETKALLPFFGCDNKDPLILAKGFYETNNLDKSSEKLILVLSINNSCNNEGYVSEYVYIIPDIEIIKGSAMLSPIGTGPMNFNDYYDLLAYGPASKNIIISKENLKQLIIPLIVVILLGLYGFKKYKKNKK